MSGFVPDPGTNFSQGDEPEIAKRLNILAQHLGVTIYGISGARTPAHSVAVGGFANDPHTKGAAADIGVNSNLRSSASQITDAQLAAVGLTRPYPGAQEINHVELADSGPGIGLPSGAFRNPVDEAKKEAGNVAKTGANVAAAGASAIAKGIVGSVVDSLGQNGARVALSIALVLAGLVAVTFGTARAFGLRPPLPPPLAAVRGAKA